MDYFPSAVLRMRPDPPRAPRPSTLQQRNDELRAENKALKTQVSSLKAELAAAAHRPGPRGAAPLSRSPAAPQTSPRPRGALRSWFDSVLTATRLQRSSHATPPPAARPAPSALLREDSLNDSQQSFASALDQHSSWARASEEASPSAEVITSFPSARELSAPAAAAPPSQLGSPPSAPPPKPPSRAGSGNGSGNVSRKARRAAAAAAAAAGLTDADPFPANEEEVELQAMVREKIGDAAFFAAPLDVIARGVRAWQHPVRRKDKLWRTHMVEMLVSSLEWRRSSKIDEVAVATDLPGLALFDELWGWQICGHDEFGHPICWDRAGACDLPGLLANPELGEQQASRVAL